jgi:mono/diheme cytochrome c family protein
MTRSVTGVGLAILCVAVAVGLAACGTTIVPGVTGSATAGATEFAASCVGCHAAPAVLKPSIDNVVNNLGTIDPAMTGIMLTNQQVADIRAYLATL